MCSASPWTTKVRSMRRKSLPFTGKLRSFRHHLRDLTEYYHRSRTHLSLEKDTPQPRPVQPPRAGQIIAVPEVGGLHHRYERHAASTALPQTPPIHFMH